MNSLFNFSKITIVVLGLIVTASCKKDKTPWPEFEKEFGGELGAPKDLPFYDSLNYNTSVAPFGIPPGFMEVVIPGSKEDRGWAFRNNYGVTGAAPDGAMVASAFSGNTGTDNTYLIFGPFNVQSGSTLELSFDCGLEFNEDPGTVTFKYSSDYSGSGNPEVESVTWTTIDGVNSLLPTANTSAFPDNYINPVTSAINNVKGNFVVNSSLIYIAMHFYGGTNSDSKRWRFDNIWLKKL